MEASHRLLVLVPYGNSCHKLNHEAQLRIALNGLHTNYYPLTPFPYKLGGTLIKTNSPSYQIIEFTGA